MYGLSLVNFSKHLAFFARYSATVFKLEKVLTTIQFLWWMTMFLNSLVSKLSGIKTDNSMKDPLDFPEVPFCSLQSERCFQCIQEDYRPSLLCLEYIHTHATHTGIHFHSQWKKYISKPAYHPHISECGRIKKRSKEPFLIWIQDKGIIQKYRLVGENT